MIGGWNAYGRDVIKFLCRKLQFARYRDKYFKIGYTQSPIAGVIPLGADPKGSDVYRIARKFGARVEDRVNEQTTHVVAARWGTT